MKTLLIVATVMVALTSCGEDTSSNTPAADPNTSTMDPAPRPEQQTPAEAGQPRQ